MPQHELLACAQCGCFAFSCFEDFAIRVSYPLWQRILGGDEGIIGETMNLDDEPYTVVGVMPQDFVSVHIFAVQPDLWIPLVLDGQENQRATRGLAVYGRLRPGASLSQAQGGMNTVAERLAADFPATNTDWGVRIVPIRDEVIGAVRRTLLVLLAAAGCVLLIACANVANLTLAKASERSREISLRTALGASRLRLARQLLTESVLLAGLGGTVGVALAAWGLRPLLQIVPPGAVPFLEHVGYDPTVLLVTVGVSLLTGIAFGLAPVRHAGKVDLIDPLKQGGRSPAFSRGARRFGNTVVVAEVAIALVLMAGAGLMIQSFRNLKSFDAGFDIEPILVLRNSLRGESFAEPHQRISHFQELARRLDSLPGVESGRRREFSSTAAAVSGDVLFGAGTAGRARPRTGGDLARGSARLFPNDGDPAPQREGPGGGGLGRLRTGRGDQRGARAALLPGS